MNESLMTKPTYPEPLRLLPDLEAAAPFPLHALGELLGGAAAAIVEAVQVPEALAAQSIPNNGSNHSLCSLGSAKAGPLIKR